MVKIYFLSSVILSSIFLAGCNCWDRGENKCDGNLSKGIRKTSRVFPVAANGDTVSGFMTTSGGWAKNKTIVKTSYDKEKISFQMVCFVKKGQKLTIGGKQKDDHNIFHGESAEIFLCTEPEKGKYYQFAVNPEGVMYSAIGKNYSWDPENVKVKTRILADRWTVDLSIPFTDLGLSGAPAKGTLWKVNFCRTYHLGAQREASNFAGISAYHDPMQFAGMIFEDKGTQSRIVMEDFQYTSGKMKASFSLEKVNEPVMVEISRGSFVHRTGNLPSNGTIAITAELPANYVPLKDLEAVYIHARNSITGRILFSKKVNVIGEGKDMLLPDKYYYTAKDKKISFLLVPPAGDVKNMVKVVLKTREGKIVREKSFSQKGSFETAGLKEGTYILSASCNGARTERLIVFRKKEAVSPELKKGAVLAFKDGAITSGGRFVYLITGSSTGKPHPQGKFFNLRGGNFGTLANSVQIAGFGGKKLIRQPKTAYFYAGKQKFFDMVDKVLSRAKASAPVLRRFTYEAQIPTFFPGKGGKKYEEASSVALHNELYKFAKTKYPELIFTLQTDSPDYVKKFVNACDLMEVTPTGGYSSATIEHLKYGLPRARKALGNKPVIFWQGVTIPNNSCRKAEELRCAVFLNIMYGSSGTIMHMGHGRLPLERSRLWSVIKNLNSEINSFYHPYRSMPLLAENKVWKIDSSNEYKAVIRGNGKEAIALVTSLTVGENIFSITPVNGWKIVSGAKAQEKENWTPYEARVIYLKK